MNFAPFKEKRDRAVTAALLIAAAAAIALMIDWCARAGTPTS